jgi:hypothetical protein
MTTAISSPCGTAQANPNIAFIKCTWAKLRRTNCKACFGMDIPIS